MNIGVLMAHIPTVGAIATFRSIQMRAVDVLKLLGSLGAAW
jgi:hypothetical protein